MNPKKFAYAAEATEQSDDDPKNLVSISYTSKHHKIEIIYRNDAGGEIVTSPDEFIPHIIKDFENAGIDIVYARDPNFFIDGEETETLFYINPDKHQFVGKNEDGQGFIVQDLNFSSGRSYVPVYWNGALPMSKEDIYEHWGIKDLSTEPYKKLRFVELISTPHKKGVEEVIHMSEDSARTGHVFPNADIKNILDSCENNRVKLIPSTSELNPEEGRENAERFHLNPLRFKIVRDDRIFPGFFLQDAKRLDEVRYPMSDDFTRFLSLEEVRERWDFIEEREVPEQSLSEQHLEV